MINDRHFARLNELNFASMIRHGMHFYQCDLLRWHTTTVLWLV